MRQIVVKDNLLSKEELSDGELGTLAPLAGVKLGELAAQNKVLWVFPQVIGEHGDQIEDKVLFEIVGKKIAAGNVAGFFGVGDVSVQIRSRFDDGEGQYFLHYMLKKVLGMNVVKMEATSDKEGVWDWLVYLFPYVLKRAMAQGMYRTYRWREMNDARVRGPIDVGRFIREDVPFGGAVAYRVREYTANNALNHLVRHTIEFIRGGRLRFVLEEDAEVRAGVARIEEATGDYVRGARRKVMMENLRAVRHPYLTEVTNLQRLCLQILRGEKMSFGADEERVRGILFDVAWLWEEYLATVLGPLGIEHPQNKTGKSPHWLYEGKKQRIYPDFVGADFVLDAKYKRGEIGREDRFQLISYLHVLKAGRGILVYPYSGDEGTGLKWEGELNGWGGKIGTYRFGVPKGVVDFKAFEGAMRVSEVEFENFAAGYCNANGNMV